MSTTTATVGVSAASIAAATRQANETPTTRPSMKALIQDRYGDSSVLKVGVIERPALAADEVLVEVRAAAIDRGTEHLMTGTPWLIRLLGYGMLRPKQPVLGLDVAGIVHDVGSDVSRFRVGDEVFGIANGSLAEYTAASESKLTHKPAELRFEQAAASSVSGSTALQALTDVGGLRAGQRVLVIGASGGVGTFAVQLARALGGMVDGVAGTDNLELVGSLGAGHVFDHGSTDLADIDERYDLVLDIAGRNPVRKLRRLLTAKGTLVIVGGENGNRLTGGIGRQLRAVLLSPFIHQRLAMFVSKEHHTFIDRLAEHLASGAVEPVVAARYDLDHVIDAIQRMENGHTGGKTVVTIDHPNQ